MMRFLQKQEGKFNSLLFCYDMKYRYDRNLHQKIEKMYCEAQITVLL